MISPTPRLILLNVAAIALALLPAGVDPRLWSVWLGALSVLVLLTAADGVLALRYRRLEATATAPELLYIGDHGTLRVSLRRATRLELQCDLSELFEPQPLQRVAVTRGAGHAEIPLVPRRRGTARVDSLWLRWTGPFGLLWHARRQPLGLTVPVVPNLRLVRNQALRFHNRRQTAFGNKVERYAGDGSEFDALRDHMPGLDLRALDWKASARHHKLLSREFRAERNHQVILCLDSGRLMAEPLAFGAKGGSGTPIPRLDHAIHAALMLAYLGLKSGDRVGLYSFDSNPRFLMSPEGSLATFPHLLQGSARIAATNADTNHTLALAHLSSRLRRRSLIVLFTEFVDSIAAQLMVEYLERLSRRHLVLFATLADGALVELRQAVPNRLSDVYQAVVADELWRERQVVLTRLRRAGIQCLDAPPTALSAQLLNRYLEIKRKEMV